jgi:hypothetical protein
MRNVTTRALLTACFTFCVLAGVASAQRAANMEPTAYDDGKSCPGGCDAHVVFHPRHNGTRNAYDPASTRSAPRPCRRGEQCRICFSEEESSCMTALYRGGGPPLRRFDFTTTFYEENCARADLPAPLARQCAAARPRREELGRLVNCVKESDHPRCRALMTEAARRKTADEALYDECKRLGEDRFNRLHRGRPRLQRSLECAYERHPTGRNSRGVTWRKLLDGACRPGHYAGRNGLDCCNGSVQGAALLASECTAFFVRP